MIRAISFILVIWLAALTQQQSSAPRSPCPNVFMYEQTNSESGRWYGVVNLSTDITLHSLWLNIVLDGKADILGNWVGDVSTNDNIDFKIENTKMRIDPGAATAVRFFIQYNPLNRIPRLQNIRMNGREICNTLTTTSIGTIQDPDTRPIIKPDTSTVRIDSKPPLQTIRPDDTLRPDQRPVSNTPYIVGPVYTPTQSPKDQSAANPYSIGDSQIPAQTIGTQNGFGTQTGNSGTSFGTQGGNSGTSFGTQAGNSGSSFGIPNGNSGTSFGTQTGNSGTSFEKPNLSSGSNLGSQTIGTTFGNKPGNSGSDFSNIGYNGNSGLGSGNSGNSFETGNSNSASRPDGVYQSLTTTKPTYNKRPSSSTIDEYGQSKPSNPDDYFDGPRPVIPIPGSNAAVVHDECGKVMRNNPNPLVVNGKRTLEGQWPWQIALYQFRGVDNKYICGGTLISRRHVITAAHCVTLKSSTRVVNKDTLTVYLGKHNLRISSDGVQIKTVDDITVHPQYNATSFSRDASILRLREDVRYTDWVRPACLWPEDQIDLSFIIGKKGSIVGWGFDDTGVATEELNLVEMPVVAQDTCLRSYSEFFTRFTSEYTYCAGARDGSSVCNGDSGGGMVFNLQNSWYIRGIVSLSVARNTDRCDPNHYVVFTDIAKFLPWIRTVISS